jgi:D-psicose/D-tagatose/L-ribulose 3-epimerase
MIPPVTGLGAHASLWAMDWTPASAERAIAEAARWGFDFVEIPLLDPGAVEAGHTRGLLERAGLAAVASLGCPPTAWASRDPDAAGDFLEHALEVAAAMGCRALTGVTYGGIGERTGAPPTQAERDNVARAVERAARRAAALGLSFGIEPCNRYETHLLNTAAQARALVERIGAPNLFVHLDTYHMNIEERGLANGVLAAGPHLAYIHLSESDRGTPGCGTIDWDGVLGALAATGFRGGLAMESFVHLPPQIASGLSVWRPVAESAEQVLGEGLPFLRMKARQYGLV